MFDRGFFVVVAAGIHSVIVLSIVAEGAMMGLSHIEIKAVLAFVGVGLQLGFTLRWLSALDETHNRLEQLQRDYSSRESAIEEKLNDARVDANQRNQSAFEMMRALSGVESSLKAGAATRAERATLEVRWALLRSVTRSWAVFGVRPETVRTIIQESALKPGDIRDALEANVDQYCEFDELNTSTPGWAAELMRFAVGGSLEPGNPSN